ncbi:hypothetical protein PO909_005781 [Leuciscus waleckii]
MLQFSAAAKALIYWCRRDTDEVGEEDLLVSVFTEADVVSMADSTTTVGDIEGELCKIERIRDILVRRESELRYM